MSYKDREYTNEENIERYLNITIPDGDASIFIDAAQRHIENFTGKRFRADENATSRLYDGTGKRELRIDDCIEVTKVEKGNDQWGDSLTEIDASDYFTLPTNNDAYAMPIDRILLKHNHFLQGHANHKITAKWGYSENPPDDIKFAATVLAAGMYYQNRGENSGQIQSEKIGDYSVSYTKDSGFSDLTFVKDTLNYYREYYLWLTAFSQKSSP